MKVIYFFSMNISATQSSNAIIPRKSKKEVFIYIVTKSIKKTIKHKRLPCNGWSKVGIIEP